MTNAVAQPQTGGKTAAQMIEMLKRARAALDANIASTVWPSYAKHLAMLTERAQLNRAFGEAMYELRWPGWRKYVDACQRTKLRVRKEYEVKAKSSHPHMAKYRRLWDAYRLQIFTTTLMDEPHDEFEFNFIRR